MKRKLLGVIALIVAIVAIGACSRIEPPPPPSDLGATAQGFNGWVGVELVMDGDRIVDIIVDWNQEDTPFVNRMIHIVQEIINNNGTEGVDIHNGATFTSLAVVNAVNEVLGRLGFEVAPPEEIVLHDDLPIPGPYTAVALGYADHGNQNAYIGVRVHFAEGYSRIDYIDTYFNRETASFVNMMHPWTVEDIIEFQSTTDPRIEVYNGATITTKALLKAVQEVLDRVNFEYVPPEAPPEDVPPDDAPPEDAPPDTTPGTPDAPSTPGTPDTPAPPPPAAGRFNPGTHRGQSNNTYSHNPENEGGYTPTTLVVEITVDDNNITAMRVVSHGEGQTWIDMAMHARGGLPPQIMAAGNTAGIAPTSGATYSARAILEATQNAINAATR